MRVSRLQILNVRNLREIAIEPAERLNLIYGKNASGKTSLLESLYVLSRGKSFRTNQIRHLARKGQTEFTIFGQVRDRDDQKIDIGVSYQNKRIRLQAYGRPVKKASQLASYIPLVVIHQESHRLLLDGPGNRRKFLDWGLFHVEPSFYALWHRYARALKQRNLSLQRGVCRRDCEIWNDELVAAALAIHQLRMQFLGKLRPLFKRFIDTLLPAISEITMEYGSGWPDKADFATVLKEAYSSDRVYGYTRYGPHRADMTLSIQGISLKERVSRGQQKLLVCALYLAQSRVFTEKTDKPCVVLIDDIAAELDLEHRDLLLGLINRLDIQVFITATDPLEGVPGALIQKKFHVEHGVVNQVL